MILVALELGIGSCAITSFKQGKLRQVLNIPDKYEIALVLALGFPDESPVLEVATDSIKRWVDSEGVPHIPKRKLEDIIHRINFHSNKVKRGDSLVTHPPDPRPLIRRGGF